VEKKLTAQTDKTLRALRRFVTVFLIAFGRKKNQYFVYPTQHCSTSKLPHGRWESNNEEL